ncbi:coiled-coil domain-containing protein 86-like [Boleophthalmus pectinirostris]|uniref:coiled-coil domain-containing protein 86-like n=1 Tax=Boleophthalmus pectinirostris TaxID=150288 RepID=UPI00242F2E07|nr:coiled-coil domain-containing protein 86-like [Boleophthalmus pectinirostris]
MGFQQRFHIPPPSTSATPTTSTRTPRPPRSTSPTSPRPPAAPGLASRRAAAQCSVVPRPVPAAPVPALSLSGGPRGVCGPLWSPRGGGPAQEDLGAGPGRAPAEVSGEEQSGGHTLSTEEETVGVLSGEESRGAHPHQPAATERGDVTEVRGRSAEADPPHAQRLSGDRAAEGGARLHLRLTPPPPADPPQNFAHLRPKNHPKNLQDPNPPPRTPGATHFTPWKQHLKRSTPNPARLKRLKTPLCGTGVYVKAHMTAF